MKKAERRRTGSAPEGRVYRQPRPGTPTGSRRSTDPRTGHIHSKNQTCGCIIELYRGRSNDDASQIHATSQKSALTAQAVTLDTSCVSHMCV